jgi:hypothetical protein
VARHRQSVSKLACHCLPPTGTNPPCATSCIGPCFAKRWPGRSLTGCDDDNDDDDDDDDDDEEEPLQ